MRPHPASETGNMRLTHIAHADTGTRQRFDSKSQGGLMRLRAVLFDMDGTPVSYTHLTLPTSDLV